MANDPQGDMRRRLAAILSADAVGYSRLMGEDDVATVRTLSLCRAIIAETVAASGGRIVDSPGDNILAEFASAVDAVKAASAIQARLGTANAELPEPRRMQFRIGVNLGDVLVENGRLYGDGVNVAARMESQAEPGGVCVSGKVYDEVAGKLDLTFEDRGEQSVKNIARPVRVYRMTMARQAATSDPAAPPAPGLPPDKPSIAVLAFQNMSGDPEQEYFSDGISEDIITDLSKLSELQVIARNSSFTYKGKAVDVKQVGRDLGVRYVLEGSVRKAGNRVRITGQLIDAANGAHVWADRFDRDLTDIFAVQDEVTREIVGALKIKLTPDETAKLKAGVGEPASSKAHDLFLMGREVLFGDLHSRDSFHRSIGRFEQAIAEDPGYGPPYAGIAAAHVLNFQNHWTDDWSRSLDKAGHALGLALEKSPDLAFVHWVAAMFFMFKKDLDRSAAEADAALALNPNYALAFNARGSVHIYGGDPLAAVPDIERAMRLDPVARPIYTHFLGSAYLVAGNYEAAAARFRDRIRLSPRTDLARAFLAVALGHLGEAEEAKRIWRELMEINPDYSFAEHVGRLPFRKEADVERLFEGLRKAGIEA